MHIFLFKKGGPPKNINLDRKLGVGELLTLETSSQMCFQRLFVPTCLVAVLAVDNIMLSMFSDHVSASSC